MKKVGFNTGVMYKTIYPISNKMLDICFKIAPEHLEVSCHSMKEMGDLSKLHIRKLLKLGSLSIHAPCHGIRYGNNKETRLVFNEIEKLSQKVKIENVVFHPDLIDDVIIFERCEFTKSVENMDWRKERYKNTEELAEFFEKTDFKFTLDINHVFTNDKTLKLANELVEHFGERLIEVHISGFETFHEPIFVTKQDQIIQKVKKLEVPFVIESTCASQGEMKKEFEYIKERLK